VSHEESPGEFSPEGELEPQAPGNGDGRTRVARLLAAALKAARLYPPGHDRVVASCRGITEVCQALLASEGALALETRSGQIVRENGELLTADIGVGALAKDMRGHGIRSIRFEHGLALPGIEGLITLLREPPLELAGRGGAEQVARSLDGISIRPYEYSFDGEDAAAAATESDPAWDLSDLRDRTASRNPRAAGPSDDIPEVQEALHDLKMRLEDATLDGEKSEETVDALLRLVENHIVSVQEQGTASSAPLPGEIIVGQLGEGPHMRARDRMREVADRVYGLILAHVTLQGGPETSTWVSSTDGTMVVPVDPEEISRICTAVRLLPEGRGTAVDQDPNNRFQATVVTMYANLVPECSDEVSREAVLGRLCGAYDRAGVGREKHDALASVADLLLTVDLGQAVLEQTLQGLRKGVSSMDLSGMLIERLPRCSNLRIHQLARKLDEEAIKGIFDAYLTQRDSSRSAALTLLKAAPDLIQSHLESYSRHPDTGRRLRVVEAAQEMQGSGATAILQSLAADASDRIRIAALKALSDRTDDASVLIFETALDASPPRVWAAVAQLLSGTGDLRVPRVLENIVRSFGEQKRPLRERLLALQTLARIPGASGRHRIVELTRYQSMREPVAALRIRNEAKRLLKSAPGMGSIGDII
jgi:hypothetical protein